MRKRRKRWRKLFEWLLRRRPEEQPGERVCRCNRVKSSVARKPITRARSSLIQAKAVSETMPSRTCLPSQAEAAIHRAPRASSHLLLHTVILLSLMIQATHCDSPSTSHQLRQTFKNASMPTEAKHKRSQFGLGGGGGGTGSGGADIGGPPVRAGNRLVVQAGDEAVLGCHVFGAPLELAAPDERSPPKWTSRRVKHANGWERSETGSAAGYRGAPSAGQQQIAVSGATSQQAEDQQAGDELTENDLVSLVFWYKDDNPTPIYTLDARQVAGSLAADPSDGRGGSPAPARDGSRRRPFHYHHAGKVDQEQEPESTGAPLSAASVQEQRLIHNNRLLLARARHYPSILDSNDARLRLDSSSQFPITRLFIGNTSGSDSGQYKCRVDFRRSRTISQAVGLLVEVPISRLEISVSQPSGAQTLGGGMGPEPSLLPDTAPPAANASNGASVFSEGQTVQFTCLAFDASPAPAISWLVRRPGAESGHQEMESLTDASSSRYGARLEQSPMSRDQSLEWRTTAAANRGTAAEEPTETASQVVAGIRLTVTPLTRSLHGAMIGCRASQQVTLAGAAVAAASSNYRVRQSGNPVAPPSITAAANYPTAKRRQRIQDDATKSSIMMIDAANVTNEQPSLYRNLQLTEWFELKLRLGPQRIEILSEQARPEAPLRWAAELDEGQAARFLCSSRGAQPSAKLSWSWIAGGASGDADVDLDDVAASDAASTSVARPTIGTETQITAAAATEGTGVSTSMFELPTATRGHHLAKLACTATNTDMDRQRPDRSMTAQIKLLVRFKPIVGLRPARPYNEHPSEIGAHKMEPPLLASKQRLKCSVQSNPPINQLVWIVNEQPIARVTSPALTAPASAAAAAAAAAPATTTSAADAASAPAVSAKRSGPKSRSPLGRLASSKPPPPPMAETTDDNNNNNSYEDDDDDDTSGMEERPPFGAQTGSQAPPNDDMPTTERSGSNTELKLSSWSLSPLIPAAIDGSKYLVEGSVLTVMNLTKLDQKDEYKCLAINSLGQGSSQKLRLTVNYKPICAGTTKQQDDRGPAARLDASLGLGLEADQIWQVDEAAGAGGSVFCQVEARPAPIKFAWSFVSLGELVKLAADRAKSPEEAGNEMLEVASQLNQSANLLLETDGPELSHRELSTLTAGGGAKQHGLLLCRALNSVGWQLRPCVNLVLTPELLEPSAGNCSVEPFVERTRDLTAAAAPEAKQEHIAISVDCSRAANKDKLLFQLAITRRDDATRRAETSGGQTAAATASAWRNKRLLFTEPAAEADRATGASGGQPTRIPVSALLADLDQEQESASRIEPSQPEPELDAQSDQSSGGRDLATAAAAVELQHRERKWRKPSGPQQQQQRVMTLGEQLELLNELVFSISASNLMRTSEPHAILGSQLRLPEVGNANSVAQQQQQQPEQRPPAGAAQVSRSASNADGLTADEALATLAVAPAVQIIASSHQSPLQQQQQPSSSVLAAAGRRNGAPSVRQQSELDGSHLEVNITLAAIGGTVVLSALTLTLIILVLRVRATDLGSGGGGGSSTSGSSIAAAQGSSGILWCRDRKRHCKPTQDGGGHDELPLAASSRPGTPSNMLQGRAAGAGKSQVLQQAKVDFLAPPVRHSNLTLHHEQSASREPKSMVLTMDTAASCHHQPAGGSTVRHLSLGQYQLAEGYQASEQQTLYVIGSTAASAAGCTDDGYELAEKVSAADVSFTDEQCASLSHLCEPAAAAAAVDHLLTGQQLVSYCSPSICTSSSHHESLATTNNTMTTSCDQQFVITQPCGTNQVSTGSLVNRCTANRSPEHVHIIDTNLSDEQQQQQQQLDPITSDQTTICTATPTVCGNSMYLFSFL